MKKTIVSCLHRAGDMRVDGVPLESPAHGAAKKGFSSHTCWW